MNVEKEVLKHFKVIITGLLISVLIVSLDSTITSTAMPKIIASLGGLQYYVWPFTIYLTTLIISAMLSGKLSDFYGSKKIFIIAIIVFVSGSILCGFSQNMTELIIFRALMGLRCRYNCYYSIKNRSPNVPTPTARKIYGIICCCRWYFNSSGSYVGWLYHRFLRMAMDIFCKRSDRNHSIKFNYTLFTRVWSYC